MSDMELVNEDGFTTDDVAARAAAQIGSARPYDDIVMGVRGAYRDGHNSYRHRLGFCDGSDRASLEETLKECFPTSEVTVEKHPRLAATVEIEVRFPPGSRAICIISLAKYTAQYLFGTERVSFFRPVERCRVDSSNIWAKKY